MSKDNHIRLNFSPGATKRQSKRGMRTVPKHPYRPDCQRCGMHMIATTAVINGNRVFECLRCHHQETCKVEMEPLSYVQEMRPDR
jgi:hypothetical protein